MGADTYLIIMFGIIGIVAVVTMFVILWTKSGSNGKYDLYNRILDDSEYSFRTTIKTTKITDDKEDE